jgi:3-methyladenine DNA glycosylase AlkD
VPSATDLLDRLTALGTEQNRKVYRRHGVGEKVHGVSYANLKLLVKEIKVDHTVALDLWSSGSHEARILATMIADPRLADDALTESWARDLDNYVIAEALASYVAKTPLARSAMERWIESDDEWIAAAGWGLVAQLALHDRGIPDDDFGRLISRIEREIRFAKNRVRHSMNGAIIAIGLRSDALADRALDAAGRIGKVVVDHGQTDCKTPDAATYIARSRARSRR